MLAPLALGLFSRIRVLAIVFEIVLGIVVGPSVLGWVTSSGASCSDNPLTHDYTITNNSPLCSVKDVFPSDWSVKLVPLFDVISVGVSTW